MTASPNARRKLVNRMREIANMIEDGADCHGWTEQNEMAEEAGEIMVEHRFTGWRTISVKWYNGIPKRGSHDFMSTGEAAFEYLVAHGLAKWCKKRCRYLRPSISISTPGGEEMSGTKRLLALLVDLLLFVLVAGFCGYLILTSFLH